MSDEAKLNEQRVMAQLDLMTDIGGHAQCLHDFTGAVMHEMAELIVKRTIVIAVTDTSTLGSDDSSRQLDYSAEQLSQLAALISDMHTLAHDFMEKMGGDDS